MVIFHPENERRFIAGSKADMTHHMYST